MALFGTSLEVNTEVWRSISEVWRSISEVWISEVLRAIWVPEGYMGPWVLYGPWVAIWTLDMPWVGPWQYPPWIHPCTTPPTPGTPLPHLGTYMDQLDVRWA